MTKETVERAAAVFISTIDDSFWEEHGIDEGEARQGLVAALLDLKVLSKNQGAEILGAWKREYEAEREKERAAAAGRFAALSPEGQKRETQMREMMQASTKRMRDYFEKSVFGTAPGYSPLTIESPNAAANSYGDSASPGDD